MRGLVVGRFQPLHLGHVALVESAIEDCVHVTVGVGSSNAPSSLRNPFTFEERRAMLEAVFGDRVEIVALPDLHDPPRWVHSVLDQVGPVDKVFGNDARTLDLFEDEGVRVGRPGMVNRDAYEASTVRMWMAEGDPQWRKAVPAPVVAQLDAMEATKRLRTLELRA